MERDYTSNRNAEEECTVGFHKNKYRKPDHFNGWHYCLYIVVFNHDYHVRNLANSTTWIWRT